MVFSSPSGQASRLLLGYDTITDKAPDSLWNPNRGYGTRAYTRLVHADDPGVTKTTADLIPISNNTQTSTVRVAADVLSWCLERRPRVTAATLAQVSTTQAMGPSQAILRGGAEGPTLRSARPRAVDPDAAVLLRPLVRVHALPPHPAPAAVTRADSAGRRSVGSSSLTDDLPVSLSPRFIRGIWLRIAGPIS
jgi:hypothetical protein